ncbi:MAG: helix-turn-helix domain-containing protein [Leptospirales bacterium]|nr:helix-turn-helix domain-containing protein [Leptospirales bacterium]
MADTATHYIAMIEGCKSFPSPEMIERLAAALGKDSTDLFALNPVQQDWKKAILTDIEKLISNRLYDLGSNPEQNSPGDPKNVQNSLF